MDSRIQVIAVLVTVALLLLVFELVRRRRLMERYALLWLGASTVLFVLAIWTGLLERVSDLVGIVYPPNALFVVAFAFVLALLLHFSLAISRLSDETKILAQQMARLDHDLRQARREPEQQPELEPAVRHREAVGEHLATRRQEETVGEG